MNVTGKHYWRSLDELADTPRFQQWLQREFPEGASEIDGSSRRTLLKLMAASFGLAGLTACRRPVEKILPASKGVEDNIPGSSVFYSTVFSLGGAGLGLVVETHDGRPTKIEGNPRHPDSQGAASAYAQASLLGLYDPDRSKEILKDGAPATWDDFAQFAGQLTASLGQGAGLRFLSEPVISPSFAAIKSHTLAKFPQAKWVEYEPLNGDNALAASQIAFGQPLRAHYHLDKADVILSLDADLLALDSPSLSYTRDFSRRRRVETGKDTMNRLYVVESQFSLTGAMADHRLRMRSADVHGFATALAREAGALDDPLKVLGANGDRWLVAVAQDLKSHRGRSVVVAGSRQPAEVHALAYRINASLGNVGETVTFTKTPSESFQCQADALRELAGEMSRGAVRTLILLGGNPAYTAPADLEFEANLAKVPVSISLALEVDETARAAKWHIPQAHYLESWGDALAWDGTASIQQPMIQPLYGGKTAAELAAFLTGYRDQRGYDIVRNYWTGRWPAASAEKTWRQALSDGVIAETKFAEVKPAIDARRIEAIAGQGSAAPGLEIVFTQSASTYDGRFANNGWMQEAPEPMTKLTWGNAALVSPATAKRYGLAQGDLVKLQHSGREITAAALIQPGQADNSIAIALGYGRRSCGRVGRDAGFNAYPLRGRGESGFITEVQLVKTGGRHSLAITQEHHSMEGRPIVREATLEEFRERPNFAAEAVEHPPLLSLWQERKYDQGNQWGMVIDLSACTGCNACVLACQAENNVPIVGKEQVQRGREMHWIRMDRYFTGGEDEPQAVFEPMACQQCENAPCESVCPVAATSHSPEGLNDMAYNRCVGTRYCANNCPYKVRRFNFLDYHKDVQEVEKMVYNPDVTVRVRGVMEKCTYCVQRIQEKKILAKTEGHRDIRDGEIVTACQQTCPAEAIVFGNINDPNSRVSQLRKQHRDYAVLAELNIKPRTSYLAKLRNPNPELVNG